AEVGRVAQAEVGWARPDARLVDDPVAAMTAGQLDVRLERRLDEHRVGPRPRHTGEDTDVAALDEPEATCAAGDLRELPREQLPPLLPVELRGLDEQQRLAGEVDPVPEHVGGDADVGVAGEEALELLAPRRERHRAVEDSDAPRSEPVDLAGESEHGLAAERHEHRARPQRAHRNLADPLERELALEELD